MESGTFSRGFEVERAFGKDWCLEDWITSPRHSVFPDFCFHQWFDPKGQACLG